MTTQTTHLTYHELHSQFWDCHIGIVELSLVMPQLKTVVIRTETGDHYLAAVHREGETLIFDLGQPTTEREGEHESTT